METVLTYHLMIAVRIAGVSMLYKLIVDFEVDIDEDKRQEFIRRLVDSTIDIAKDLDGIVGGTMGLKEYKNDWSF